jgi:hypothetical protein
MANIEQINLLQRSVEEWNDWRIQNLAVKPDFNISTLVVSI